jgi:hypothetical protein
MGERFIPDVAHRASSPAPSEYNDSRFTSLRHVILRELRALRG